MALITITPDTLKALDSSVTQVFTDTIDAIVPNLNWDLLATRTDINTERGVYDMVYSSFRLEELPKGEMKFANALRTAFELISKEFGQGLEISKTDFKNGKTGTLLNNTKILARAITMLPQDLVVKLLKSGETAIGYDKVAFFSDSHPIDLADASKGTYDNLVTSFALSAGNLAAGIAMMMAFQGPDGHTRNLKPDLLIVPPQLTYLATNLVGSQYLDASSNPYLTSAGIQVVTISDLADEPGSWYLAAGTSNAATGIGPFVYQVNEEPSIQAFVDDSDYSLSVSNKFAWLVRGRSVAGLGHPFQMIKFKA